MMTGDDGISLPDTMWSTSVDLDLTNGFVIGPHAARQMQHRGITQEQIEAVLQSYHTSYPAEPLAHQREQSTVCVGTLAGRDLKVYVRDNSNPPHVRTVVWKGEEQG
jgi:acetyl-CoA acetyltransferase